MGLSRLMKRPLVLWTVIFCCGIILAHWLPYQPCPLVWGLVWFYSIAIVVLIAGCLWFRNKIVNSASIYCLIFLLGIILYIENQTLSGCNIAKYLNRDSILKGVIYSQPVCRNKKTEFVFKVQEIQNSNKKHSCRGNIMVYINGLANFHCADELIVRGNLYQSAGQFARYLQRQGILALMNAKTAVCSGRSIDWQITARRFIFHLRESGQRIIYRYLSPKQAAVVEAMVLGEKRNIPGHISNLMIKTGTVHILVVSGFNVGIIAFVIMIVMKSIRVPRRMRLCLSSLLLVVYCFLTGASTPVVRATIMALLFMFSYFIKRETDIYNCCSLAAIMILAVNPSQLFDIGFQLSFVSILSIAYIYPRLKLFLGLDSLNPIGLRLIISGILVSFSAWLGTMGLIVYYFKIISLVTVLANIFIVPLASLVTLCGLALVITGFTCPILADCFSCTTKLIISALFAINNFLAILPGAYIYFG